MTKEDKKEMLEIFGFILLIILGFIVSIIINQKSATKCIDNGGKAIYTNYGIFEKCIK